MEAVQRQAAAFSHTDFSVIAYESVRRARGATGRSWPAGGGRRVALFNAGAEAIENAVKFAKAATGRPGVIAFEGGFHGRTLLTMSMTSRFRPYKSGFGPFAPEVYRLPYPYPYRTMREDAGARALERIRHLFRDPDRPRRSIACAVIEPQQGEGGFVVPTPEFLPGLAEICREHGILRGHGRDPDRVRSDRAVPGVRALRVRARHRGPGQGPGRGLPAVGGDRLAPRS